jgi:hypothetical protein
MYRRIAVVASLAVLAAMFVGSSTASASHATGNGGVCVFTGLAGGLNPPIQNALEDLGVPDNIDVLGALDIERGSYNFSGGATCVGKVGTKVFAPIPDPQPDDPLNGLQNVTITSNGFYDNIICGTGFAHDQPGTNTNVTRTSGLMVDVGTVPPTIETSGTGPTITGVGYEILFVAGNGPLLIGLPAPLNNLSAAVTGTGAHHAHPGVSGGYVGAGAVHITPGDRLSTDPLNPTNPDNCINLDTDTFEVAGGFVAVGKPLAHPPL